MISACADGSISADAEQLGFALDALIENAIKFTGRDDEVGIARALRETSWCSRSATPGAGSQPISSR